MDLRTLRVAIATWEKGASRPGWGGWERRTQQPDPAPIASRMRPPSTSIAERKRASLEGGRGSCPRWSFVLVPRPV